MASNALISAEQYLKEHLSIEHPPEFVRGELIQRSMPKWLHARLQVLLGARLRAVGLAATELHLRLSEDTIRIADIALFLDPPREEIPASPPFVVVEIVSPDDSHEELLRKLIEYRAWGVQHIWVVEPSLRTFHKYEDGGLIRVEAFELPELNFFVDVQDLFAEAIDR